MWYVPTQLYLWKPVSASDQREIVTILRYEIRYGLPYIFDFAVQSTLLLKMVKLHFWYCKTLKSCLLITRSETADETIIHSFIHDHSNHIPLWPLMTARVSWRNCFSGRFHLSLRIRMPPVKALNHTNGRK